MTDQQHNTSHPEGALRAKIAAAAEGLAASGESESGDVDTRIRERVSRLASKVRASASDPGPSESDTEVDEKPKLTDDAIRRKRRQLMSAAAELQERKAEVARERQAAREAVARLREDEALRESDPAEWLARQFKSKGGTRAAIKAAFEHDKLPPDAKAKIAEAAELRSALRQRDEAETAAQRRAAETKGLEVVGGIFARVVKEADLTEAEVSRVKRRGLREAHALRGRLGRAPTMAEFTAHVDRVAATWPEFADFVASKRAAGKPAPKTSASTTPTRRATPAKPKTLSHNEALLERLRAGLRRP